MQLLDPATLLLDASLARGAAFRLLGHAGTASEPSVAVSADSIFCGPFSRGKLTADSGSPPRVRALRTLATVGTPDATSTTACSTSSDGSSPRKKMIPWRASTRTTY